MTLPMWRNSPNGNFVINEYYTPTYARGYVACQSAELCGYETAWQDRTSARYDSLPRRVMTTESVCTSSKHPF